MLNFALGNYAYTPSAGIENFTGLQVPAHLKSTYERSIDPNWYGASAVQGYEGKFSFFINTDSAPADNNRPDPLYTTNYQVNFSGDIRPWSAVYGNNPGLCNASPSCCSGLNQVKHSRKQVDNVCCLSNILDVSSSIVVDEIIYPRISSSCKRIIGRTGTVCTSDMNLQRQCLSG